MTRPGYSSENYEPDRLIAGEAKLITRNVTLTGSAALTRGAVLGRITASGFYTLSAAAAGDGSEVPRAILVAGADPTGGDVVVAVYDTGHFNEDHLSFGAGHDADSVRGSLGVVGIHLKKPISVIVSAQASAATLQSGLIGGSTFGFFEGTAGSLDPATFNDVTINFAAGEAGAISVGATGPFTFSSITIDGVTVTANSPIAAEFDGLGFWFVELSDANSDMDPAFAPFGDGTTHELSMDIERAEIATATLTVGTWSGWNGWGDDDIPEPSGAFGTIDPDPFTADAGATRIVAIYAGGGETSFFTLLATESWDEALITVDGGDPISMGSSSTHPVSGYHRAIASQSNPFGAPSTQHTVEVIFLSGGGS